MSYHHITSEQRYTIDVLLRQKKSRKEIAETIGVSESALCREIKRNSGQRGYHYKQAQVKAADRQRRLQNYRNLTLELRKFIREKNDTGTMVSGTNCRLVAQAWRKNCMR